MKKHIQREKKRRQREEIISNCLKTPRGRVLLAEAIKDARGLARDRGIDPSSNREISMAVARLTEIREREKRRDRMAVTISLSLLAGIATGMWLASKTEGNQ